MLAAARPDEVLVTIPDITRRPPARVVEACAAAGVQCRLVRSHTEITEPSLVAIPVE